MKCPVTHKTSAEGQCPVIKNVNHEEAKDSGMNYEGGSDFTFDKEYDEEPSVQQIKKIRRYTKMITTFYENGYATKSDHVSSWDADIESVSNDIDQAKGQLEALQKLNQFKAHLKYKEYEKAIQHDIDRLSTERESMLAKSAEMRETKEWAKGVVETCHWLEANLDDYCLNNIKGLPEYIQKKLKPLTAKLDEETAAEYARKLDEIVHNLNESRDFFEASIDGRLDSYQEIEQKIIENQISYIRSFDRKNKRRQFVEAELLKDMLHVEEHLDKKDEKETKERRQAMLDMHLEFLKVLTYFRNTMKVLGNVTESLKGEQFVSKYTDEFVLGYSMDQDA